MARFEIEDELHDQPRGEFAERGDAWAELHRLAAIPWDHAPNQAPCQNWRNCGRHYELIEFDETVSPPKELHRELVLEISAGGVKWHRDDL